MMPNIINKGKFNNKLFTFNRFICTENMNRLELPKTHSW
jgi:hypothetical protein